MHWFPCLNGRRALIARCTISIGFSSNLSRSLYSGLSVRLLVSADNPQGGYTNSNFLKQAASAQESVHKSTIIIHTGSSHKESIPVGPQLSLVKRVRVAVCSVSAQ